MIALIAALWPWLIVAAVIAGCAFIRDGQDQCDRLLEDPAVVEARRVWCEANKTAFDRFGVTR